MKKIIIMVAILMLLVSCSGLSSKDVDNNNDEQKVVINYEEGLYAQGQLVYNLVQNNTKNNDLDENLMGVWYSDNSNVMHSFYVDGTYVRIILAENAGALLSSGTWVTNDDKLTVTTKSYDKQAASLGEEMWELEYVYQITANKLVLDLQSDNLITEFIRYQETTE